MDKSQIGNENINVNFENLISNETNTDDKVCILCNKSYNYRYYMFGRKCLLNLYDQLHVNKHGMYFNQESHLWNSIAHRNFKFFLSKQKKQALLENYIALDYIKKMNLQSMNKEKDILENNIKNISAHSKLLDSMFPIYSINDFYKVYHDYKKFIEELNKLNEIEFENKKNFDKYDESILTGLTFIFDMNKITVPLYYEAFYGMQYLFWKAVVAGGLMKNMKLSSYLLNISLDNSEEYDENNRLVINNGYVENILLDSSDFKETINKELTEDNINIENLETEFKNGDLFYSLHNATLNIKGNKKEKDIWKIQIEILDTYDFTDIKGIKEHYKSTSNIPKSLFSSTLNNYAAVSSSYGVIKTFAFKIVIENDNYKKE